LIAVGDVKLTSPKVRVVRDGHDDLEVQTDNRDLVLWDRTRVKHRWPKFDEAAFLWMTFVSWSAARRMGAIPPDLTFERWEAEVLDVAVVEDDDPELGTPTQPGLDPG
jgi:hypothetical protein